MNGIICCFQGAVSIILSNDENLHFARSIMKPSFLLHFLCWGALSMNATAADAILDPAFADNMVVQREMPVPIWGKVQPGLDVSVSLAGTKKNPAQSVSAHADEQGRWMAKLQPMKANDEPTTLTVSTSAPDAMSVSIGNILIGDVWVCSGQSNMAYVMNQLPDKTATADADFPRIRQMRMKPVKTADNAHPQYEAWAECTPESAKHFTAVGYYFARMLHQRLDVPIGLVNNAVGGTPAAAWTREAVLRGDPEFQTAYAAWEKEKPATINKKSNAVFHEPSILYNSLVAPLMPMAIKGVIWYQGENDANNFAAQRYARLFPAMITDWRGQWGEGDFPFLFVQLASFHPRATEPQDTSWARLRESQAKALALPNTGMAVAIDVGEADNIHPARKQPVGERLAMAALHIAYGQENVPAYGPMYDRMDVKDGTVVVHFKNAGGGLVNKGENGELDGFAIAGANKKFYWAEAKVEGETVVVSSPDVPAPVAVRYAWADNPEATLYNQADLPAVPFRTDDWPQPAQPKASQAAASEPASAASAATAK